MGQLRANIPLKLLVPSLGLCCRFFCPVKASFCNLSTQSRCLSLTCFNPPVKSDVTNTRRFSNKVSSLQNCHLDKLAAA